MTVSTRASTKKSQKMSSLSQEVIDHISKLIEPLATTSSIQSMFDVFRNEIKISFEKQIDAQNEKIAELESKVAVQQKVIENLSIRTDDIESYSRRSCVRVHGIEYSSDETPENIKTIVKNCYKEMNVDYKEDAIERVHRIGNTYKSKGKNCKSLIVKFKSWDDRVRFYQARPKRFRNGSKKPVDTPFSVSLDLTKRRYNLLKETKEAISGNSEILYVFADINCKLALRLKDNRIINFNSRSEIINLIKRNDSDAI